MSWIDMYQQSLKNYQNMREFYLDYDQKMKMLNDLFDKAIQYINKINEIFLESVKLIASMYEQYKAYIDNFQRTNQQWIESQWSPFLAKAKVEETEKIEGRKKG
jgi:hypothetical protein